MSTSAGIGLLLAASLLATTLSTSATLAQSSGQTIKERADTSAAKPSSTSGAQKDAAKPAGPVTMDTYPRTKADRLADEQDKILDRKIKGICKGC